MRQNIASRSIATRVPQSVAEAVQAASAQTCITPACYARVAILEKLVRGGWIRPQPDTAAPSRR